MKDTLGREIDYLRITVTDRRTYDAEAKQEKGKQELTSKEILRFAGAAAKNGIKKIRLTGGEPLLRDDLPEIVKGLKKLEGIEEVCLTTDATLIPGKITELKKAGLDRINVNVDSLDPATYAIMTGGGKSADLAEGLACIDESGIPMKWNVTVVKGLNDDEILSFAQVTLSEKIDVRFIELTPGSRSGVSEKEFIPGSEISALLGGAWELPYNGENARLYKYMGASGKLGLITPVTNKFCDGCNKICLTEDGKLKTCLCSGPEFDVRPLLNDKDDEALEEVIRRGILAKEKENDL